MKSKLLSLLAGMALALPAWSADLPRAAPDLRINLPSGEKLQLSGYKGRVVALEFLLTTCPHCQRSSKTLNKLLGEYQAKGFEVLGVAINPMSHMLVADYIKDFQLTYPVGYDSPETAHEFLQVSMMERMLMPQVAFIDRAGNIRAQYAGNDPFFNNEEANMRAKIEELLQPGAASKKTASANPAKK